MNESQKSQLIKLAAEMALGKDMPPEFIEDWSLPKSTSQRTKREILIASMIARLMCRDWSKQIMSVVNEDNQ